MKPKTKTKSPWPKWFKRGSLIKRHNPNGSVEFGVVGDLTAKNPKLGNIRKKEGGQWACMYYGPHRGSELWEGMSPEQLPTVTQASVRELLRALIEAVHREDPITSFGVPEDAPEKPPVPDRYLENLIALLRGSNLMVIGDHKNPHASGFAVHRTSKDTFGVFWVGPNRPQKKPKPPSTYFSDADRSLEFALQLLNSKTYSAKRTGKGLHVILKSKEPPLFD